MSLSARFLHTACILLFLTCLTLVGTHSLNAQSLFVSQAEVLEELNKRGLEFEEVQAELAAQGIDLVNLDVTAITAEQIQIIERTILRLEAEKNTAANEVENNEIDNNNGDAIKQDSIPDAEAMNDDDSEELENEFPPAEIYGQSLFRDRIVKMFNSSDQILAPESYVLGPGDEIVISVWGKSQFENVFVIENDGFIRILESRQRVFLKGLTLAQARKKLQSVLSRVLSFSPGEFDLALNYSRTVSVSIYGEVLNNPGTYTMPAFNTAFNALAAVNGTNNIGSLRKIQLSKSSGQTIIMDVYELLRKPSVQSNLFLDDNDVIMVPVADNIVTINGAVRRPFKYELIDGEGLKDLISYAGGFTEDAFKRKIQLTRFVNDDQKIFDLDWRAFDGTDDDFMLQDGDVILVESIETEYRNFVEIGGEVQKPGRYERLESMRLSDLIQRAGLTDASDLNQVFLTRYDISGQSSIIKINLADVLNDPADASNLTLQNRDVVEVWKLDRFSDELVVKIAGSVRSEGSLPYDASQNVRVRDAILLAGGLTRDASNFAIIHSNDPLNPKIKSYRTIDNLDEVFANPSDENNLLLEPFDSLVVASKNTFIEESYVRIEGAVNNPGNYQYGSDMTIKDLMILSGGFKMAASTNNIEVSRVIIRNNQPTKTIIAKLELDKEFNLVSPSNGDYKLEPFDNIAVRYINEFELQQRVFLEGEFKFPGPYAISVHNEKISSIIERAGGLTDEAFPAGATLVREDNDYGSVVIKLEEIMKNTQSEFNFVIKNGDRIFVPKIKEFVTIRGATKAKEVVGEGAINEGNEIHVPFHKGKDAMFYINEYAGGLSDLGDKQKIFVKHANGEIRKPTNGVFRKKYPKVQQGSTITVGYKIADVKDENNQDDVNWTQVLGDSVAQAMSILTLILVIQKLD